MPRLKFRREDIKRVKVSPAPEPTKKNPNCWLPVNPRVVSGWLRGSDRKNQAKAATHRARPKMKAVRRPLKKSRPCSPLQAAAIWKTPQDAEKTRTR